MVEFALVLSVTALAVTCVISYVTWVCVVWPHLSVILGLHERNVVGTVPLNADANGGEMFQPR